ncbi:hypothetical protein B9Q11_03210 [Candidatus Marsarchaeota G2 archaeon ECH_B_SAG-F08]|jgi:Predicted transcriptional regulators|uniref:Transcription regulator PadR N-terminal domain-containing protein n=4 Tax=Candidatus Marsarchaeota TaxID=1978152 RepID=A0A2R6BH02_9ARCH|nr:MAG: hypothetical protein B9Q01_05505 [Candidatus Marsarchaeota G1 archaeon OSP_D]PSN87786.1 MAG: hypothetical protein B9Q00_07815 [Candidatus Marsarchaeota G1 archaeon OSP_C]PSN96533.1 MAG: hypothetical protein B9P99_00235 [Candidatus Marsarchaeota G1 archaeon OSP_B]PSN97933.1 MAG: hypothetical protein B9Q11_03210 [Candidatus Marsarchaeota G2 archaeon ECH_B_SAG-F08]
MLAALWEFGRRRRGLRFWVLYTLKHSPSTGAEIMDEVERMSFGLWRPSPGSIYPLLEQLSKEGVIRKRDDGKYELTEKGREEVESFLNPVFPPFSLQAPRSVDGVLDEISAYVSYLEDLARTKSDSLKPYSSRIKELAERLSKL